MVNGGGTERRGLRIHPCVAPIPTIVTDINIQKIFYVIWVNKFALLSAHSSTTMLRRIGIARRFALSGIAGII